MQAEITVKALDTRARKELPQLKYERFFALRLPKCRLTRVPL
jgi:hypothetical protein